eukprot:TRINITY_DN7385_c0_g1_i1.p1 TRINITY_DN7385_c0_g1~~TRINITY_DN7385_c0_g1_i1.p1  ORF type:complete len:400 (-),score=101.02 TRINITY_DN7385_c0_g1_i1:335-1492(-)
MRNTNRFDKRFLVLVVLVIVVAVLVINHCNSSLALPADCNCPEASSSNALSTFVLGVRGMKGRAPIGELRIQPENLSGLRLTDLTAKTRDETGVEQELNVVLIESVPPFAFAMPSKREKEGVALSILEDGVLEEPTQLVFQYLLSKACGKTLGGRLVVDAGANLGYFTTYSAVMGCRVISFEPQPRLGVLFRTSLALNGVSKRVTLHNNIITSNPRDTKPLKIVYQPGCWACSFVEYAEPGDRSTSNSFIIPPIKIDDAVDEDVLLLKIDVEGFEVKALTSAEHLLTTRKVENILIEWSPTRWPRCGTTLEEGTAWLERLYDMGYTVRHYNLRMEYPRDGLLEYSWPIMGLTWEIPRHKLRHMNEWLTGGQSHFKEANLWFAKER